MNEREFLTRQRATGGPGGPTVRYGPHRPSWTTSGGASMAVSGTSATDATETVTGAASCAGGEAEGRTAIIFPVVHYTFVSTMRFQESNRRPIWRLYHIIFELFLIFTFRKEHN